MLKVKVNSSPVERLPESQMDCSLVVVCGAASSLFFQVTLWLMLMVRLLGAKVKSTIATVGFAGALVGVGVGVAVSAGGFGLLAALVGVAVGSGLGVAVEPLTTLMLPCIPGWTSQW